ncbi:MAG: PIN domain-containing protein, partial [Sulfobacillus sp.]
SPDVLDEMERNVGKRAKAKDQKTAVLGAAYVRVTMESAFPDALVMREQYQHLVPAMQNDPKDRHVLAAVVAGRADLLVTRNGRHFGELACSLHGIEVQDPDTFLVHQCGSIGARIVTLLTNLAEERRSPMDTPVGIVSLLEELTPRFCALVQPILRAGPSA